MASFVNLGTFGMSLETCSDRFNLFKTTTIFLHFGVCLNVFPAVVEAGNGAPSSRAHQRMLGTTAHFAYSGSCYAGKRLGYSF